MGYKKASVAFWVTHTTLEKKVKCAKNNPNHKPNVPLVTEEETHFAPFVRTVLLHMWGKTERFTFFSFAIFHVKMFFFLQYKMPLVTLTVKDHK
jgi:hypothetical protein